MLFTKWTEICVPSIGDGRLNFPSNPLAHGTAHDFLQILALQPIQLMGKQSDLVCPNINISTDVSAIWLPRDFIE